MASAKWGESQDSVAIQEASLAAELARGGMPLARVLRYATELAMELRHLHDYGLEYGAVGAHAVVLRHARAALVSRDTLAHLAGGHADVAAFGGLLREMLAAAETPVHLSGLRAEALALAQRCRTEKPRMRQVSIALRLMGVRARQGKAVARPPVFSIPVAMAPQHRHKSRRGLTSHLKSLAEVAARVVLGKVSLEQW